MKTTLKTLSVLVAAVLATGALASPTLTGATSKIETKKEVLPVCVGLPEKATEKKVVKAKIETVASKSGSMVVTVKDYFGEPIAGALVELDPQHGSGDPRSIRTDKNGRAEFGKLRADNWRVVVHFASTFQWSLIKVEAGRQSIAEFWDSTNPIN